MQVLVHTPDTEINTTNLGLKSIVGQEKRRYLQVQTSASANYNYLTQSRDLVTRLQRVVSNLIYAANTLIKIDQSILDLMKRSYPGEK